MKNFNLIEMAKAMKEHKLRHMWRYAAMMALLLGSVCGQAWGATTAPSGSAHTPGSVANADLVTKWGKKYEVYFSNNASKSSLLVGSNTSATTQSTGTDKWCNIGSSCGNSDNNVGTAFTVDEFVSNVKSSNNKAINIQSTAASEKNVVMVVSGYDSIAVFAKSNDISVYAEIWGGSSYGDASSLTLGHTKSASSHYKRQFALDKTKQYRLTIAYGTSGSSNKNLVAFSLCYTPSCSEITPTFSTDYASTTLTVGEGNSSTPAINKDGSLGAITWTSSDDAVATVDENGVVTPVAAGSATITATVAEAGGKCEGSVSKNFTIVANPLGSHTITYTLSPINTADASLTSTQVSTSTYLNNLTTINASLCGFAGSPSKASNRTAKINRASSGKDDDKYIYFTFEVEDGYQFTPSSIVIKLANVSDATTFDASLISSDGPSISATGKSFASTDGTVETWTITNGSSTALTGTVTLKIWPYAASAGSFRFGTPITIDGTVAVAAAPSCTAPSSVSVAATNANGWRYTIGETIDLTATATGGSGGSYTYKWQKYIDSDWEDIDGATNARFQKASCTSSDGGSYRCVVSTGAGCELASSGYQVYVFTLNGNYYGGVWTEEAITWTGANTGTVTLDLTESSTYMYKVTNNDGKWYGGTSGNFLVLPAARDHYTDQSADIRLFTGPAGDYTFTIDITHFNDYPGTPYVNISVAYPTVSHPAAGYAYFKKWNDWSGYYIHWWYNDGSDHPLSTWGSDPQITTETTICGTDYIYFPVLDTYNQLIVKDAAGTGSHSTGDLSSTGSSSKYFDFTNDGAWNTFTTYTITFAGNSNTGGSMSNITGICPSADQVITTNAYERTGYTFNGWKTNAALTYVAYGDDDDGTHEVSVLANEAVPDKAKIKGVSGNITLTAQWTPITYTITYKDQGDVAFSGTHADGYPTTHTYGSSTTLKGATKTGYTFGGWFGNSSCTGDPTASIGATSITANITLYAKWTVKTYNITLDRNGASSGSESVTMTYNSSSHTAITAPVKAGYTFDGWYDSETDNNGSGNLVMNASGVLQANVTGFTGAGGIWTKDATCTLYAKWTAAPAPAGDCGEIIKSTFSGTKNTSSTPSTITFNTTGEIGGTSTSAIIGDNGKLNSEGAYLILKLSTGTFLAGDTIKISSDKSGGVKFATGTVSTQTYTLIGTASTATSGGQPYYFVLAANADSIIVPRGSSSSDYNQNPKIAYVSVCRPCPECDAAPSAPTSPTNGATTSNSQAVSWTDASNDAWEVYVSTSSSTPDAGQSPTAEPTTATYTFTGLTASTTYYWWVRSVCDASHKSAWVAGSSFETSAAAGTTYYLVTSTAQLNTTDTYVIMDDGKAAMMGVATGSNAYLNKITSGFTVAGDKSTVTVTSSDVNTLTLQAENSAWNIIGKDSHYITTNTTVSSNLYGNATSGSGTDDFVFSFTDGKAIINRPSSSYHIYYTSSKGFNQSESATNIRLYTSSAPAECSAAGLAYATDAVAKNVGDAAFTNALTNPHSVAVTYSSSVPGVATVNETSGMVTIEGAGETTITATWAGNATYCAGTATYTLNVSSGCTPQSLVKTQLTSVNAGTTTGYNDGQYAGDPVIATFQKTPIDGGYKMTGSAKLFVTIKGGFVADDKINIVITQASDLTYTTGKLLIFYNASSPALLTTIDAASAGTYTYTLTASDITTLGSNKTIGVFRSSGETESNPYVKSVEVEGCREWAVCTAPDAVAAGSVTGEGATFTITDAANTNNYEIYYSTSSTAPTAETSATVSGISSKNRAVTGLTASTTYYYWVRSNCGGATKSSWVAGTPASFMTAAAAATHSVTYNGNENTGGSVPTDDNDYEEGDVVTVLGNTGSLVKTGQTFLGWSTSATASSGTFYPAGYKFYMPNAAVTLYAVWGSTGATCVTLTDFETSSHDKSSGKPDSEGKYFYGYKGTKSATYAVTITTPGTGTVGVNGGDNLQMAQNTRFNIYADNTTTGGTPATFSSITSISFKIKAVKNTRIPTIDVYVGSTKVRTVIGGDESKSDGHEYDTSDYTTISITGLASLSGIVKFVNTSSGSSDYKALFDDIQICYGSGAASGFTVSFDMNGYGSAIADIENVPSGSKIGAPVPSPTAVGVEFDGWYREAGCTNAWNFGSSTISKDTTLYANWTTCAPSISAHPVAATYTKDAAATALNVTAIGEGLNYQWYTSEDDDVDISGSSAIPGATSASYTPSTSLLGTIYYFCVVSNTCGNAVSNKAAITVNDSKPVPTANWVIDVPKEGGKGFTFSIEVNKNNGDNWDGELIASMLTLSDNAILDGASIVVDNTNKTISGTYGVKAGSSSPVTFYLLLPATTSQSATRLDHDQTFTPCAGGVGDSYNVPVRKDYEKDASNNYRWVTPGAGEITYAIGSSISSAKASSAVGDFDSIMSNDKQYIWVKTYEANTKTIRLHVETSGANVSVSNLYKNTVYTAAAAKDRVSSDDYSVSYDGSGSAENTGTKGTHYMDITFDSPLDANDIICIMFSSSKVKAYGAVLTTVGDGGDQTTGLTWSNGQASGATLEKREDAADFTITAERDATALKSLGLISYTSSNTAIATIDGATGLVHIADNIDFGSDEFKTTTITATLAASGCYKKKVITYILKVTKHECEDAPGTITYVDHGCSMDLTLEGYEEGATIQWYKDGANISEATSATYNATEPGEYYAVTHKTCYITSTNSVTLKAATATAEKIVDQWYVKNGRRTPDIALVQTTGATSFTVTSGGTITEIGGCTFELKEDGIIYLHGQKEDGSAPSDMTAGDMTITITVSGCAGALSGLDITIHKQAETAKPTVAFVVDGTLRKDGGTATSVSTAKTSDRPLWTYLSSSYALTGCNVYWSVDSKELREYYSQFDAILITDDPNTQTKGTGDVPYVKAFGTMVDVRPILTMEAFVGRYSDGGWHVYNASPSSPNPRQVEMKLECKNHDIFKGLDPNASDNVRTTRDEYDNEYWHVIMVDTTVAPYHNTSKDYKDLPALQGFDPHKFDHMLGVGTIADETLQGGVERQEEPAARMMILGIQNEAMAALTNEGKLIIKNAIEYLLKTNMEDVNDCSNYFTDETGNGLWNDAGNWTSNKVPDFETRVRILRPVVISDDTKAIVARVDIATSGTSKWVDGECNGSVTVNPRGALIVSGKIRRAEAPHFGIDDLEPTENDDLIVKAEARPEEPHKQGALIFDNSDGDTHAVVEMWNPSYWEVEGGKKKKYWSYVAVPIQEADIPNFFWYGFTYLYDETSGWIKKSDGTSLYPFQGIGASLQDGHKETFYGPLATTESQDITLTYTGGVGQGMNLIGNSWTAPIQIANFEEDDFGDAAAEVWVFNTGDKNDGHSTMTDGSSGTTTAGQWQTIPIGVAGLPGYTGLKVIPAMQAFEVNTTSETTLHLDYDRLVRAGRENLNEPMRAPRRGSAAKQIEATMRVRVSGELTHTDVYLLKDARFSDGFDNGWDGHYLFGDDRSASLYAVSETEGAMAFLAQPEIDGTILGFAPSRYGNDYTFTFYYLGEEEYYLNDLKEKKSTLISEEESYLFTFEEGDTNRFYISKTPFNAPSVATGTENTGDGTKARKVIYNNHVYIIRAGKVYGIDGTLVVPNMEQK